MMVRASSQSRWRRLAFAMAVLASALVVCLVSPVAPVGKAAATALFRNVQVQVRPDGQIVKVAVSTVSRDRSGTATDKSVEIDPLAAVGELPVRVQTAWWADGEMGTDLSALTGRTGRITIQLTVVNLTAGMSEVSYEADGRKYRQQALVAVPLTVSASADLGTMATTDLVTTATDNGLSTDGMVAVAPDGTVSVQWARLLAPPLLSPTASLTLVVDARNFTPPTFDIVVQPGLVTDPSVTALIGRRLGEDDQTAVLESSTIRLVSGVDARLREALAFVDQVHEALQGDVSQISQQAVAELIEGSATVLGHLQETQSQLMAVQQSTQTGIDTATTQTQASVTALLASLEHLMGSTETPPETTGEAVDGCVVSLPRLADGQPQTIASSVYVLDAQLRVLTQAFDDQAKLIDQSDQSVGPSQPDDQGEPPGPSEPDDLDVPEPVPNCRTTLTQLIATSLGDPSDLVSAEGQESCQATAADQRTVACALFATGAEAAEEYASVMVSLHRHLDDWHDQLGINQLMAALGPNGLTASLEDLREQTGAATTWAESTISDLRDWATSTGDLVRRAKQQVEAAKAALAAVSAETQAVRAAFDLVAAVTDPTATNTVTAETASTTTAGPTTLETEPIPTGSGLFQLFEQIADRGKSQLPTGEWYARSGMASVIDNLVSQSSATAPESCPTDWADNLTTSSSATDIDAALVRLIDPPGCAAAELARATQRLVSGYDKTAADLAKTYAEVAEIHERLLQLNEKMRGLDQAITAVEAFSNDHALLPRSLAALYDASPSNLLDDIQSAIAQIESLLRAADPNAPAGDLAGMADLIGQVADLAAGLWPDDTIQPVGSADACPPGQADTALPGAQGQAVVRLANQLYCADARLGDTLSAIDDDIANAAARTSTAVRQATGLADAARNQAAEQIGALSEQLTLTWDSLRATSVVNTLTAINEARAATDAKTQQILDQYGLGADMVVQSLAESMAAAQTDSATVQQALSENFAALVANLGGTDPSNRAGLIGKLYGISGQVGQTGEALAATQATVTAYGASRSADLREINLQAAQFDASQDRLADYHPFANQPDQALTVFVFHLAG